MQVSKFATKSVQTPQNIEIVLQKLVGNLDLCV